MMPVLAGLRHVRISRRGFHRWAGLTAIGAVAGTAGCGWLQPAPPGPPVSFDDLVVTESVAGTTEELRIRADGMALSLLISESVGGRIPTETLDSLRELLESDDLRREAAELAKALEQESCEPVVTRELRIGAFQVVQQTPCTAGVKTPTLDGVNGLLDELWKGGITEPLGSDGPELPRITVEGLLSGKPDGSRIEINNDRTAVQTYGSSKPRQKEVPEPQFDALRMISAGPFCESPGLPAFGSLVTVGDNDPIAVEFGAEGGECLAAIGVVNITKDLFLF